MYLLEEKGVPGLKELLKDVSSMKELEELLQEHLEIVDEMTRDEFDAFEEPMKYIELRDYTDTIRNFLRLV